MAEREQKIKGPFGGQITEEGQRAYDAIAERFGSQTEVTLEELSDFMKNQMGVEHPALIIMFGGAQEMLQQGLGFVPWVEETWQDTERFGRIPGVPKWRGFRRVEGQE